MSHYGESDFYGVLPAEDKNLPSPQYDANDPVQRPTFLLEYEEELIAVRKELSALWSEEYGVKHGSRATDMPVGPYGKAEQTVSSFERDIEYRKRRDKLEERESVLMALINEYKWVASLGDAPAEEDILDASEKEDEMGAR